MGMLGPQHLLAERQRLFQGTLSTSVIASVIGYDSPAVQKASEVLLIPCWQLLHELCRLTVIVCGLGIRQLRHFQDTIGGLRLCSSEQALGHDALEFLGCRKVPGACLIEQLLSPVKMALLNRLLSGIAELSDGRIVCAERADTFEQRLVVRGNFPQLRIEVFWGDVLLLKDFEEARQSSLRDTELCGQTLKLFRRNALVLRNSKIQIAGGDVR